MNERIIDFIEGQKVATVCGVDEENKPFCFSCFFAFDKERQLLYFKSSSDTPDIKILKQNAAVAGTIQPDKLNPLAIKGIQFSGVLLDVNDALCSNAKSIYHRRYAFALAIPGEVYTIQLEYIKMTDRTLNIGKKLIW